MIRVREATLLNGAFKATFEKGRWKYTPTFTTTKPETKVKEPPQYPILLDIETASTNRFQSQAIEMSKELCTFISKL